MSTSNDPNNQNNSAAPDWRTERQIRRDERRAWRNSQPAKGLAGGVVLIVLGIIFLLRNTGLYDLQNWWALFILIPAFGAFGSAWAAYQNAGGQLTAGARASLLAGLMFTMLAAIFLFNLNLYILGPVILILLGLGFLLNTLVP